MTKKMYMIPMTEIVLPQVDDFQNETVDVYISKTNPNDIEANDTFFDEEEEENADFWDE